MIVNKSNFWICGFEYNQYLEFIDYLNTNPDKLYLTFYHCFYNDDNDILFLYCRSVPKKIKGGLFGYCVLKDISKPNNMKIKVFKDDLVNVCYNEIKEVKTLKVKVEDFLLLEDLFENSNLTTHKSFSIKYIKKFLRMENVPIPLGEYIKSQLDKKFKIEKKDYEEIEDKATSVSDDNLSESEEEPDDDSIVEKSDPNSDNYSESEDDKSVSTNSNSNSNSIELEEKEELDEEEKLEEENNKNGLVPIMIELCKKFRLPNLKYDKKKFNNNNNPDVLAKCKYFKDHISSCTNCNIINNNNQQLSFLLNDSKLFFKEHLEVKGELEEGIEKYQSCKKFDAFCYEDDKFNIRINYIGDDINIYYRCVLLFITQKSII